MEENKGKYAFNPYSIFQNHLCQADALPFSDDFQSTNIGSESNVIDSFNQTVALGNNHYIDDDWSGVSIFFLVSHEDITLYPEYDLVK